MSGKADRSFIFCFYDLSDLPFLSGCPKQNKGDFVLRGEPCPRHDTMPKGFFPSRQVRWKIHVYEFHRSVEYASWDMTYKTCGHLLQSAAFDSETKILEDFCYVMAVFKA